MRLFFLFLLTLIVFSLAGHTQDIRGSQFQFVTQDYSVGKLDAHVVPLYHALHHPDFRVIFRDDLNKIARNSETKIHEKYWEPENNQAILNVHLCHTMDGLHDGVLEEPIPIQKAGEIVDLLLLLPYVKTVEKVTVSDNDLVLDTEESGGAQIRDGVSSIDSIFFFGLLVKFKNPHFYILVVECEVLGFPYGWPNEAPVFLTIANENNGKIRTQYELVELIQGLNQVKARTIVLPGHYEVAMGVDPRNIVNEINEENNIRSIWVKVPEMDQSDIEQDLFLEENRVRIKELEVSFTLDDPGLKEVISAKIIENVGGFQEFLHVVVHPPWDHNGDFVNLKDSNPSIFIGEIGDDPNKIPDLYIDVVFQKKLRNQSEVIKVLVQALSNEWYATSVEWLNENDSLSINREKEVNLPIYPHVVRLGLNLSPTDQSVKYWHIQVPVARESKVSNIRWHHFPKPPIAIQYVISSHSPNSSTLEEISFTDYRKIPFGGRSQSVGIFEKLNESGEAVVSVDPFNTVKETNEENNSISLRLEVTPNILEDLYPVREELRISELQVTTVNSNPDLHTLISANIIEKLGFLSTFVETSVFSSERDHGSEPNSRVMPSTISATDDFDLIAKVYFQQEPDNLPNHMENFTAQLSNEWYIDSIVWIKDLDSPEGTDTSQSTDSVLVELYSVSLGFKLAQVDQMESYWKVEIPIVRDALINDFPNDKEIVNPVAIEYVSENTFSDDGITVVSKYTDYRWIMLNGRIRSVGVLKKIGDTLKAKITVDPENAVEELSEENNSIKFERNRSPKTVQDLFPICEKSNARVVGVTSDPSDPFLIELVNKTALQVTGEIEGFRNQNVLPWHSHIAGIDRLFGDPEIDFDLVLLSSFSLKPVNLDEIFEKIKQLLETQWYADRIIRLGVLPDAPIMNKVDLINGGTVLAIGIQLSRIEIVRQYYRVQSPVARIIRTEDLISESVLVSENFTALNRFLNVPVQFEISVPTPESVDAFNPTLIYSVRDYLRLSKNQRKLAVGYFEQSSNAQKATLLVDPENEIEEKNEENNICMEVKDRPYPQRGEFNGTASFRSDSDLEENSKILTVNGSLKNNTNREILLKFGSTLQMDFTINDRYQWAELRLFPQVMTDVSIAPGEKHTWTLEALLNEIKPDSELIEIKVFLVGYRYFDKFLLNLETNDVIESSGDQERREFHYSHNRNGLVIQDHIVGENGIELNYEELPLLREFSDEVEIVDIPAKGELNLMENGMRYMPDDEFNGEDLALLMPTENPDGTEIIRRFKAGLQNFKLDIKEGWNLISFPIRPIEPFYKLLSRIPQGYLLSWRDGRYNSPKDVEIGEGLWIFSSEDITLEFLGEPESEIVRKLTPGWNLIGTVNNISYENNDQLTSILSWDNQDYSETNLLKSGRGYWVKVEEPVNFEVK